MSTCRRVELEGRGLVERLLIKMRADQVSCWDEQPAFAGLG